MSTILFTRISNDQICLSFRQIIMLTFGEGYIYSVYKTSRSNDVVCRSCLHDYMEPNYLPSFKDSIQNNSSWFIILFVIYETITILRGTSRQRSGKGAIRKKIPTPKTEVGKKPN